MLKKVFTILGVALCILLAAAIAEGTWVAYQYVDQSGIYEPVVEAASVASGTVYGVQSVPHAGWHYAACPELIRDKAETYPESVEFAVNYYIYGDNHLDTDISEDVAASDVPLLLQWDNRWGYRMYGTNYMGNNGCGPTALAIVYAGLTGKADQTPYDMAMYALENGWYWSGKGTHSDLMTKGAKHYGLTVKALKLTDTDAIKEGLRQGELMIAGVSAGDFTVGGHFIVLAGITEDDRLIIRDPNSRINSDMLWDFQRVMDQTTSLWSYTYKQ